MRLLIVDDDKSMARTLVSLFKKNNHDAEAVHSGQEALERLEAESFDAMILDVMMPEMEGLSVLRRLREDGCDMPILILSAKCAPNDKVVGLDSGANDYMGKPFDSGELLARVRAMTRGSVAAGPCTFSLGSMTLNRANCELSTPHGSLRLPRKEYQLMELFMRNPRQFISTGQLVDKIWSGKTVEQNVVWVYISYLRRRLVSLKADAEILVARNTGYMLKEKNSMK